MPFVKVPGAQIHYQVPSCLDHTDVIDNQKPTVVLLHPRLFDSYFFTPQFRDSRLARGYNLVTMDHHYHGKTRAPLDDKPYNLEQVAQDMLKAMKALKISKGHIFGLSLGSQIAIAMQTSSPECVTSLILCGLPPEYETEESLEQYRFLRDACCERADDGSDQLPSDVVNALKWIYFSDAESSQTLVEEWAASSDFKPSNRSLVMKSFSAVLDHKPIGQEILATIKCPVLVLHGASDVACPESAAQKTYDMIGSRKEIHIIPGAPHFLSWTHPLQVNKLAADFLDLVTGIDSMEASHQVEKKASLDVSNENVGGLVKRWFTKKASRHF